MVTAHWGLSAVLVPPLFRQRAVLASWLWVKKDKSARLQCLSACVPIWQAWHACVCMFAGVCAGQLSSQERAPLAEDSVAFL